MSPERSTETSPQLGDAAFRDFIADLFAASAAMQSLRRVVARSLGIGSTELAILLAVARLSPNGPVGIKQVADHLHVVAAHITTEVNALVKRRLVKKGINKQDSRAADLTLAAQGTRLLSRLAPVLDRVNNALFEAMDPQDMAASQVFFRLLITRVPTAIATVDQEERPRALPTALPLDPAEDGRP